jgi:hypothetical protein
MDRFFSYLKLIVGTTLIILGIIAMLFCKHFDGSITLNLIIFGSGLLSLYIGYLLVKYHDSHIIKKLKKDFDLNKDRLIKTGLLKKISFKDLTVGGRSEINVVSSGYSSKVIMLDGIYGIDRSKKTSRNDYSIIVYADNINGKRIQFYSPEIDKDSETLSFLLERQGIIDLYIDNNNFDNYYFDLNFLEK